MIRFKQYLLLEQPITWNDLNHIEKYADQLFKMVGINVEFTKHFLDRVNDPRNGKPITVSELVSLFNKEFQKYGDKFKNLRGDSEAVLKDMATDINTPVAFEWNKAIGVLEMIAKTVMRKHNFLTKDKEYKV
jgi:hypothetical protein